MTYLVFFPSLLGKKLRKGQERISYLSKANDRKLSSSADEAFKCSPLRQKDGFC